MPDIVSFVNPKGGITFQGAFGTAQPEPIWHKDKAVAYPNEWWELWCGGISAGKTNSVESIIRFCSGAGL